MTDFKDIQNFYFIGIGGIGMSALARYFSMQGKTVLGYDKTPSTITNNLVKEGVSVTYIDAINQIPEGINPTNTLVVYTPAIPKENTLLTWFINNQFTLYKRAKVLGEISKTSSTCLAVAGTHGKTTTSAILGHILAACDMSVTAFLGGISENYHSNLICKGTDLIVVEADEFDRSFLQLEPNIACITSMDADHLDIYETASDLEDTFKEFSSLVSNKEHLFYQKGLPLQGNSVSVTEKADFYADNVRVEDGEYAFDLVTPQEIIKDFRFHLPGRHNLFNAVTALGMAIKANAPVNRLPKALQSFNGVQRRFSYKIKNEQVVLIDDYAHHPTEINALYQAVSEMYPNDEKLIVFQPHLFSRTKDFADGFATSLSQFNEVLLLDIYPAREEPIEGVTSSWLLSKMESKNKKLITKNDLSKEVKNSSCRIKLLVGAGDIGAMVEEVTKNMSHEN